MQRYANWARDDEGRSYPGATVSVFIGGTQNLATIHSAGGDRQYPSGQPNPITTGGNGFFSFAADDGVYDIQIQMGSSPVVTISNIVFLDTVTTIGPDVDFIDFTPQTTTVTYKEGRLYYDSPNHTLTLFNDLSGTSQQIGLETWIRVRNRSGVTINDGEVVYIDGATGQMPTCRKAISTAQNPSEVIGLATITMADQAQGWVTLHGCVNNIDTSDLTEGATVYLSGSTAGGTTSTAPANAIQVGVCVYSHAIHGKIMVRVADANTYAKVVAAKLTDEGGLAVLLTNDTGAPSVKGEVVTASASVNNGVTKIVKDVPNPIGVFLDSGVANGQPAWVVVSGIASVYFVGNTTRDHIARGFLTSDGASYVAGQALSEAVPTSPFATDKHFYELGHVLESRTGAGLAKTNLHFN